MLRIEKLSFSYKHLKIIDNFSLDVKKGEFICLLGPSGCGKTTLLKCIVGLLSPYSGKIIINGKTNMVFQEYNKSLFPWKTVNENVIFGLKQGHNKKRAEHYLKLVNLEKFKNNYPFELSGGMQQRVAIARALAYDSDILVFDEPFNSLDMETRNNMQSELNNIWKKSKKTIIFVTHNIDEALILSNKIVVLSNRPLKKIIELTGKNKTKNKIFRVLRSNDED